MNNNEKRGLVVAAKGHVAAFITVLITSAICAGPLFAQQASSNNTQRVYREGSSWVQETTGTVTAAPNLSVRVGFGNINVQGSPAGTISYTYRVRVHGDEASARRKLEAVRFTVNRSGDTAYLDSQVGSGSSWSSNYNGELTVQVPRSVEFVRAVTRGGNEYVSAIAGRVEANTAGGNVRLDDIGGNISAVSGGGNVDVNNAGADVALKTGGGNIQLSQAKGRAALATGGGNITVGTVMQSITAQTGGGEIDVKQCGGDLTAQSGGGSLDLGRIGGRATLQSGGGSIRLMSAAGPVVANTGGGGVELYGLTQGAQVTTGGGQITAEFLAGNFTGSSLQTPAGDIIVYLGSGVKATVRAAIEFANGHRIRSDFGEIKISTEGGQYGPKTAYAEGNLNGGGPLLRVRTTNGDIDFRRAKK